VTETEEQVYHLVPNIHRELDGLLKNNVSVFDITSPCGYVVSPRNIQKFMFVFKQRVDRFKKIPK
jgi:hypothetical protein